MSWNSRRISHWAIVHRRSPLMWMSARRFVVITRFVRVALGKTNRASSPGIPAADELPVQLDRPIDLFLVPLAQGRVRLGQGGRQHRRGALERDVALALLVERDAGAVADELVGERPRHAADPEREHDVLDRRAVARLDHPLDELLLLGRIDLPGHRAAEDLVRLELRVARPAGGVDERDVELLDDLAVGEEEGRLHPEVAPPRILRDPGLLASERRLGRHRGQSIPSPPPAPTAPPARRDRTRPSTGTSRPSTGR